MSLSWYDFLMSESVGLQLFDYDGTARSGKGTMVGAILASDPENITVEEAGTDFRALTLALLSLEAIAPEAPPDEIVDQVGEFEAEELSEMLSLKHEIIAEFGPSALYQRSVNSLVGKVGQTPVVQEAVTQAIISRVTDVRDKGEHKVLLLDGRNLTHKLRVVDGLSVVLRTFVTCSDLEAALREAEKEGLDFDTEEGQIEFRKIHEHNIQRNKVDRDRKIYPVRPDDDAIIYWNDPATFEAAVDEYIKAHGIENRVDAIRTMFKTPSADLYSPSVSAADGAGNLAASTGRQMYFDTTPFRAYGHSTLSVQAMVSAARQMFDEGLEFARQQR